MIATLALMLTAFVVGIGVGHLTAWALEDRARATAERQLDRAEHRHQGELTRVQEFYRTALDQVGKTATYGTPEVPEAITTHDPTPEVRLAHQVKEDTIERGVAALRAAYTESGLPVPDAVALRDEVVAISQGLPVLVPAELEGFVGPS